ncbi:MAG: DUF3794 domain-containing protein [Oscillospiraceae bacterium]|nr:DUF3794 domain-containing protein [Oscillospiraceae bacterium]
MELKKQTLRYFQAVLDAVSAPEISADMIVPDLYPDMAHIADATGQACVKETALREDRLDLTGMARIGVLYLPEGEDGLRKLDVSIPFNHVFDGRFPPGSEAHCGARLLDVDVRAVNPRKVSVLARLSIHAVVHAPAELSVPFDVDEPCEIKRQACAAYMPVSVKSKNFTVTDEMGFSPARPPMDDIVAALPRLEVSDVKTVGSKVVFKGAAHIRILYISGGEPVSVEHELPLSQIIDMDGLSDGAAIDLALHVTGVELDIGGAIGGDGRGVSITLHAEAQAVAHAEYRIEAIVDLYSTADNLRPLMEPIHLTELVERGVRRQPVREMLETDGDARSIVNTSVALGPVTRLESGEIGCEAYASLLYVTEDGEFRSLRQKVAVPSGLDTEDVSVSAGQAGEIAAAPSPEGIELRFSVDFTTSLKKTSRLMAVGGVQKEEARERPARPGVVLRRCHPGEGLWEIAKQYCTTISELCLANGLEDCEAAPDGKLLLIPKKRS